MKAFKALFLALMLAAVLSAPAPFAGAQAADVPAQSTDPIAANAVAESLFGMPLDDAKALLDAPVDGALFFGQPLYALDVFGDETVTGIIAHLQPSLIPSDDGSLCTIQTEYVRSAATQALAFTTLMDAMEADLGPLRAAYLTMNGSYYRFPSARPDAFTLAQLIPDADTRAVALFDDAAIVLEHTLDADNEQLSLYAAFGDAIPNDAPSGDLPIYQAEPQA